MGKERRPPAKRLAHTPYSRPSESHSRDKAVGTMGKTSSKQQRIKSKKEVVAARPQSTLFNSTDKILLVGEGDFSFSVSLAEHHYCSRLTATTLESRADLLVKYPQAAANLEKLTQYRQAVLFGINATKIGLPHTSGAAQLRKTPGFDLVVFNFPHIGGKSTDVNRQVRANQELVVKFFEGAKRVLAPGGAVIITIFEGQPYELWGVRNLARHAGFHVESSMRFDPTLYPGYRHVRTLGNVPGGWRGEDRDARIYILRKAGEQSNLATKKEKKGRRASNSETDSD